MASQRTPEQLISIILKATQHLVAVGGMQNFSYPKLAAETGINAPTVYEHYKNKEALLTTCFLTIDDEIARKIANAPKNLSAGVKDLQSLDDLCWLLWLPIMTAPFSTGTSAIRSITHRRSFSSVCKTEKRFGSLCSRSMDYPRFLKSAIWKCWFGISLTTRWQWLPRCLGVFIQTMRSMSIPCIIWSFSRCSPCSDRIAAMITKQTANNRRPLHTAEHLAIF